MTASVRHSQTVSADNLRPWVAAEKDGIVICAHCNCMAGLGEACSHIAALLMSLSVRTSMAVEPACTSLPCQWIAPSMKTVEYARVIDIDLAVPDPRKDKNKQPRATSSSAKSKPAPFDNPTAEEVDALCASLDSAGSCAVLSTMPAFSDRYAPKDQDGCPPYLVDELYNDALLTANFADVLQHCEKVFSAITVTAEEAKAVERLTKDQATSKQWFRYRAGRVTASRFKAATRTNPSNPSVSLIKAICYPEAQAFTTSATKWGCEHEASARELYVRKQGAVHKELSVTECGLCLSPDFPYLGASPDGFVSCACCGAGVLEIMCPYSCRDKAFADAADESKFCLEKDPSSSGLLPQLRLKHDHAYYYQVQLQLKVCAARHCDFIVWNKEELHVERILPDAPFMAKALEAVVDFYKLGVLPELAAKWYSKNFDSLPDGPPAAAGTSATVGLPQTTLSSPGGCYCDGKEAGDVAKCANTDCTRRFFRVKCLGLKKKPGKSWHCPECRKAARQKKSKA